MESQANKDLIYLSQKPVALNNPGTKMDDIYYSAINSTVEISETTYNFGRYTVDLTSLAFGGSSNLIIPNNSLSSHLILRIILPNVVLNQTLPWAWGYSLIKSVTYLMGSSNTAQLELSTNGIFHTIMGECETSEKRNELVRLGGELITTPTTQNPVAYVFIPLPFSSICGLKQKLPFDTTLLDNPIQIQIAFNEASSIYGGSGTLPGSVVSAKAILRQGDMTNKDQGLKAILKANPDLHYSYPFIHKQVFNAGQNYPGSVAPATPISITLQSIINSDLVGLSISAVPTSKLSNPSGTSCPSPLAYSKLSNVKLLFNGNVMYYAPDESHRLINMFSGAGSGIFHTATVTDSAVAPFAVQPYDVNIIYVDFARIRSICFDGQYQNTWRVGNNALTLELNTPTNEIYTIVVTYYYNGLIKIQNGQSYILFN